MVRGLHFFKNCSKTIELFGAGLRKRTVDDDGADRSRIRYTVRPSKIRAKRDRRCASLCVLLSNDVQGNKSASHPTPRTFSPACHTLQLAFKKFSWRANSHLDSHSHAIFGHGLHYPGGRPVPKARYATFPVYEHQRLLHRLRLRRWILQHGRQSVCIKSKQHRCRRD